MQRKELKLTRTLFPNSDVKENWRKPEKWSKIQAELKVIAEGQSLSSLSDDKFNKVQKKERLSFCIMLGTSFKTYILEHWENIFVH